MQLFAAGRLVATSPDGAVERKMSWIRESAGERLEAIEFNLTIRDITITDDRRAAPT